MKIFKALLATLQDLTMLSLFFLTFFVVARLVITIIIPYIVLLVIVVLVVYALKHLLTALCSISGIALYASTWFIFHTEGLWPSIVFWSLGILAWFKLTPKLKANFHTSQLFTPQVH